MGLFDSIKNKVNKQPALNLPDKYEFKVVGIRYHADDHDKWVRNGRRSISMEIEQGGQYNGAVRVLGDGKLIGYIASEQADLAGSMLKSKRYAISQLVYEGRTYLITLQLRDNALLSAPIAFIDNSPKEFVYREQYFKELEPITDVYYDNLKKIEDTWSLMFNAKEFGGVRAEEFKKLCLDTTGLYVRMGRVNKKYNETHPSNCPAYKRLAMLYEKQGKYEEAADICAASLRSGSTADKMGARYIRMIKKTGREPNEKELELAESVMNK